MSTPINDITVARQYLEQTAQWQAELNTLSIDLLFFQRMLDIYGLKSDPQDLYDLKQRLQAFIRQQIEERKRTVSTHHEYLKPIAEDRVLLKDREMPYIHKEQEQEMLAFRRSAQDLKDELYRTVEELKNFG